MARKEINFTVEDKSSRDFGKEFKITEMAAIDASDLAEELFRIMGKEGFTGIPEDVISMGCAGLASLGINVLTAASPEVSRKLRDTLLDTVEIVFDNAGKVVTRKVNARMDFEEVSTIRTVLDKVFEVNFSFLTLGGK